MYGLAKRATEQKMTSGGVGMRGRCMEMCCNNLLQIYLFLCY